MIVLLAVAACSSRRDAKSLSTSDDVLATFPALGAVRLGDPLESARAKLPRLAPSGWAEGTRATWLDPEFEAGLEIETDRGNIRAVAVTLGPERSGEVEEQLTSRLGRGVECSPLPEGISSFRPRLWRMPDGGGVSLMRKQRILTLRLEKPAGAAFETAWKTCQ
ncbi:MAG: hypothetical protein HY698_12880 [Deltaproteobacteria bacterium]|nr:hypothetical protein [Deltaproteobacteria bacterium]